MRGYPAKLAKVGAECRSSVRWMREVPRSGLRAFTFALMALITLVAATDSARAADVAAGASALRQARAAWDKGSFDVAEPSYREALEKGGLAPDEVLESYVRLGAIRAADGRKDQSVAAFRAASVLDASFTVPSEGGPRGWAFATQAKKDTAKIGTIHLWFRAPTETPAGQSFRVTAQLDAAHVPMIAKVGLVARDGTSGNTMKIDAKASSTVDLEVPASMTLPNASIALRVDALDSHDNRLASTEQRIHVTPATPTTRAAAPVVVAAGPSHAATTSQPTDTITRRTDVTTSTITSGGGFWSTPWPYIIGSIALTGAGAAGYFGIRSSYQVTTDARTR
ncbi:MAG: hypothetical protein FWD73_10515 [Polyangiaceae bacterium]|nr:hypothetical protein [Polyangiaceae bacterium]